MDEKFIEKHFPALFDKMIDEQSFFDKSDVLARILLNNGNKVLNKSIHSECILNDLDDCNSIINAHSIQNSRILKELSENGKVIYLNEDKIDSNNVNKLLIGRNEATTFRGYCKKHDEIFNPIEHTEYEQGNMEQNYLFAYRAFAKSYIDNITSSKYYNKYIEEFIENLSLEDTLTKHAKNIEEKSVREIKKKAVLKRQEIRMKQIKELNIEFEQLKEVMNINLFKKRYYKIETVVISIPVKNTIACSSLIYIYADLNGRPFNSKLKFPSFITIVPQNEHTVVLLSYFKKHKSHFELLIRQIKGAKGYEQELIISNLLLKYGNNIVYSPRVFKRFNKTELDIMSSGLNRRTQQPGEKLVIYPVNLFRPGVLSEGINQTLV